MRNSLGKSKRPSQSSNENRRRKIRVKNPPRHIFPSFEMTREEAVQTVLGAQRDQRTLALIDLFQLTAEELTEAGLSYEALKVLQQNCLSLR